ncbi:MAG: hypothetical protein LQ337_000987 [Flavoplaca oasis]|nr:MAG: hypothetical protein LQ337_000987 [Flavoplaca oasis]
MDVRGHPPMTRGRESTMPQPQDFSTLALQFPTLPRPILASNHSNSLPSTPYQHARKLNFNSRSPSPAKPSADASPRSTHSESEKTQVRGPFVAGCKFETGMAHSRRRIPYSVGGEQLDRPDSMPKKYLNPAEEDKLSGDMRELYDRILPSKDSDERRTRFVKKLERILNEKWPGNNIGVHVFGSSGNMLCTNESDVDICITTPMKSLERVCHLAAALAEHGMERVVCVNHAKVPIVKIWDPELQLACDMNVNNTLALENTRMIKTYVEIDERVRPLAMIIKYWTRKRILNDAALGGTLSSYTWICMILNFLQTRNPPVLPCLHKRPHQRLLGPDGKPSAFADDLNNGLRGYGQKNKETLGELLFHFFRRYAYELDYEKNVISVREGTLISKEAKRWHLMQNNRLCVEEPFNIERNLGNTADDISFRGLHLEIRRAFGLVAEAKLSECTQQYEYPAVEERIWEKPAPKPPPILSRSHSQSGRGGKGSIANRGGRNGPSQNRAPPGRRASSAATTGRLNGFQYGQRASNPREHPLQAHYDQLQLHERFLSEYQLLQAQEQELRIIQAQSQLHAHAQAQAHVHGNSSSPMLQLATRENTNRPSAVNAPPLSAPIRNGHFHHPPTYPSVHADPGQTVHTNPSSPSMRPTQLAQPDLRRRFDRSSAAEAASSASRSHSQPARPLPMGLPMQNLQAYPMGVAAFQQYQQARQQQFYSALEQAQRNQRFMENHNPRPHVQDLVYEESLPKEYVGYYVHDSPSSHAYRDIPPMSQIPVYNDLQYFRPPRPDFSRLRNAPRSPSPSPSMPYRDRSQSVRSAMSAPPASVLLDPAQLSASSHRMGPIIADGSDEWDLNDYISSTYSPTMSRTATMNGVNAAEEQRQQLAMANESYPSPRQTLPGPELESIQHLGDGHAVPKNPRVPDAPRISRTEQPLRSQVPQINGTRAPDGPPKNRLDANPSMNGLGIQQERQRVKPYAVSNGDGVAHGGPRQPQQGQPPDRKTDPAGRSPENSLEPPPLLSPVREVRSPSPTVTMKKQVGTGEQTKPAKFGRPLNLDIPPFSPERYEMRKQREALLQKPSGTAKSLPARSMEIQQATSSPSKPQGSQPQINGWQQQTKKGKKKSKGHTSQLSTDTTGEPIPMNEAERKGG